MLFIFLIVKIYYENYEMSHLFSEHNYNKLRCVYLAHSTQILQRFYRSQRRNSWFQNLSIEINSLLLQI